MAKRGGVFRNAPRIGSEKYIKVMKKLFFTFLDSLILLSFALSVYFTYFQDYTRTILFMAIGCLLLMFFIVRGILKTAKSTFFS
jgi:hypothetical protein